MARIVLTRWVIGLAAADGLDAETHGPFGELELRTRSWSTGATPDAGTIVPPCSVALPASGCPSHKPSRPRWGGSLRTVREQ